MEAAVAVTRVPGFAPPGAFVAEITFEAVGGPVTVREYGETERGALFRAETVARGRLCFRRFRAGFYTGGLERLVEACTPATFPFGFAA